LKLAQLQSLVNFVYRHPKAEKKQMKRFGGRRAYKKMLSCEEDMKLAALSLPPVHSYADGLPVIFLTGKKYLFQTLFCISSLAKNSTERFQFILVDDGSFDEQLTHLVNALLPGVQLITARDIEINLQKKFPKDSYPVIHRKRAIYPHLKKLTDIHTIAGVDWKLVLDSDMLFFKEPTELISWLKNPDINIFMKDCEQSYGYSELLMEQLCGFSIPEKLNVGVVGMRSSAINWDCIETWIKTLEGTEGTSYFLEQALTAMLAAGQPVHVLTADDYIVKPGDNQIHQHNGTLHHYVDLSKQGYFTYSWKQFV
jgi:hypothetical protein